LLEEKLTPIIEIMFTFDENNQNTTQNGDDDDSGKTMQPPVSCTSATANPAKTEKSNKNAGVATKKGKSVAQEIEQRVALHCLCRLPESATDSTMVRCDSCDEWYHLTCIHYTASDMRGKSKKVQCPLCLYRRGLPSSFVCQISPLKNARRFGKLRRVTLEVLQIVLKEGDALGVTNFPALSYLHCLMQNVPPWESRCQTILEKQKVVLQSQSDGLSSIDSEVEILCEISVLLREGIALELDVEQQLNALRVSVWEQCVVRCCLSAPTSEHLAEAVRSKENPFDLKLLRSILDAGLKLGAGNRDTYKQLLQQVSFSYWPLITTSFWRGFTYQPHTLNFTPLPALPLSLMSASCKPTWLFIPGWPPSFVFVSHVMVSVSFAGLSCR
jgi:hypothetical protein